MHRFLENTKQIHEAQLNNRDSYACIDHCYGNWRYEFTINI